MSVSVERSAVLALLLGVSLLPACMKAASEMSRPADAGSAEYADAPPDPLVELEQLEGRMRELGLAPSRIDEPAGTLDEARAADGGEIDKAEDAQRVDDKLTTEAPPSPAPMAERDQHRGESRCTSVCELSEAICDLEVRICSMAKNHGDDPTYANACERAVDDCELSGDACDSCNE